MVSLTDICYNSVKGHSLLQSLSDEEEDDANDAGELICYRTAFLNSVSFQCVTLYLPSS